MKAIIKSISGMMKEVEEKSDEIVHKWSENSQKLINGFLDFFSKGELYRKVRKVCICCDE